MSLQEPLSRLTDLDVIGHSGNTIRATSIAMPAKKIRSLVTREMPNLLTTQLCARYSHHDLLLVLRYSRSPPHSFFSTMLTDQQPTTSRNVYGSTWTRSSTLHSPQGAGMLPLWLLLRDLWRLVAWTSERPGCSSARTASRFCTVRLVVVLRRDMPAHNTGRTYG